MLLNENPTDSHILDSSRDCIQGSVELQGNCTDIFIVPTEAS